ncbi:MAG: hypothetical protein JWQ35_1372 [Bacteriovoracaceae bacterium]|nr:hypothetical protein [Bacteriovoracaceae bacterium]
MKTEETSVPVFDLQTHHSRVEVPTDFDLRDLAKKYSVFPLKVIIMDGRRRLLLAMKNPFDQKPVLDVEFRSGMSVVPVQADEQDIVWLMQTHYFGKKLSPRPSAHTEDVTHDVFEQFEMMPDWKSQTIKPFSKEEDAN